MVQGPQPVHKVNPGQEEAQVQVALCRQQRQEGAEVAVKGAVHAPHAAVHLLHHLLLDAGPLGLQHKGRRLHM